MNKLFLTVSATLVFLLCGCSSVVNAHLQKKDMMTAYETGNNQAALTTVNNKLAPSGWGSVVNTGDEIHWRLEAGALNFHLGNFEQAVKHFSITERLIKEYDDRAVISARDAAAEAGAALTNLNALPYRGLCRDRIALSIYQSLAYLGCGKQDSFRVQIKRLRNAQNQVLQDYRKFFEQEKAEIAAARKKNPGAAKKADRASESALTGNPQNAAFSQGLQNVRKIAHKGYGNFLNPAAIFLSGLSSVRDGDYENARIDFKRLYEAMPGNPLARQYYATVLRKTGRPLPPALRRVPSFNFPLERDCVFVISALGKTAAFKQISVYFPVMTAWPMCEFYDPPFNRMTVHSGPAAHPAYILADMDGIIAQEFNERLPMMITRIVISTAIKEAAKYAGTYAASRENALAGAAVYVGSSIYTAMMNTADTRSWEILPKEFHLTQLPLPADRKLKIILSGREKAVREIELPENCRSAVVFVNAPGSANIACHVLPLKQ